MITFHIFNVYVDKTQPHQFMFTFKARLSTIYKFYMHFLVIVQRFEHFYVIALYKLKYYY